MAIQQARKSNLKSGQEYFWALKFGDEKALKLIMERWYSKLYNFAIGYLKNEGGVEEVIQDVFLQLWDNREKLADTTSLNAYLFTLTRSRCIDAIRRERLLIQFHTDRKAEYNYLTNSYYALSDSILDHIFEREFQEEIDKTIRALPTQCQKVFYLSREKGLKNREIGEKLNIAPKTVETHITKALKTIKNTLERKFPDSFNLILILVRKVRLNTRKILSGI